MMKAKFNTDELIVNFNTGKSILIMLFNTVQLTSTFILNFIHIDMIFNFTSTELKITIIIAMSVTC